MANNVLHLIFAILMLVLGAGIEELLPKFAGVGFPVLFASVPFFAMRHSAMTAIGFAMAAGAMEDSISSLPTMSSVTYFVAVAVLARWTRMSSAVAAFAYPGYQLWLALWISGIGAATCLRFLVAVPIGVVTSLAVAAALGALTRKAALDVRG